MPALNSGSGHADLLIPFFLITFTFTWGYSVLARGLSVPPPALMLVSVLGSFAPSLVALGCIAFYDGMTGIREVLRHFLVWRVGVGYYLFAVFYMPALVTVVGIASVLVSGVSLGPIQSVGAALTVRF